MKRNVLKAIILSFIFIMSLSLHGLVEAADDEEMMEEVVDGLFMIVTKGEYDREEAFKMIERVRRIPPDLYEGLIEEEVVFKLINFPMTDLPEFAHLKGVSPGGGYEETGRTWDDVVGAGGPVTIAVIGKSNPEEGVHSGLNLELHEVAHPIDMIVLDNISTSWEFYLIHKQEQKNFLPQAHYNSPVEYFAESFAYYYLNIETNKELKEKAPETYEFIQNLGEPIIKDTLEATIQSTAELGDSKLTPELQEVLKQAQSIMENPIATQVEVDEINERLASMTENYIAEKEKQRIMVYVALGSAVVIIVASLVFVRRRKNREHMKVAS